MGAAKASEPGGALTARTGGLPPRRGSRDGVTNPDEPHARWRALVWFECGPFRRYGRRWCGVRRGVAIVSRPSARA